MAWNLLETPRLILRRWRNADHEPFARINADPAVMEHFPSVLAREASDALVDRVEAHFGEHGFGLWALQVKGGPELAGFVGLMVPSFQAPFMPCVEVGWRLASEEQGKGLATEAAREVVRCAFEDVGLREVVSFTVPANVKSRRVMEKLGMVHAPDEDFDHPRLPAGHPLRRHVLYRLARTAVVAAGMVLALLLAAPVRAQDGGTPQGVGREGALRAVLKKRFPDRYRAIPIFGPRTEGPLDVLRAASDAPRSKRGAAPPLTCAVVGSSSNLLGAGQGRQIDRHAVVIRSNLAPVGGHEADVGARTTHYVINEGVRMFFSHGPAAADAGTPDPRSPWGPVAGREQVYDVTAQWILKADRGGHGAGALVPREQVHPLNGGFYEYIKEAWLHPDLQRAREDEEWRPSTGFLGVMVAVHACDQVDVYGFGPDARGERGYYYKPGTFTAHKPPREEDWLRRLDRARVLTFHGGRGPQVRR